MQTLPLDSLSDHSCRSMSCSQLWEEGSWIEICLLSHLSKERIILKRGNWLSFAGDIDLKAAPCLVSYSKLMFRE